MNRKKAGKKERKKRRRKNERKKKETKKKKDQHERMQGKGDKLNKKGNRKEKIMQ